MRDLRKSFEVTIYIFNNTLVHRYLCQDFVSNFITAFDKHELLVCRASRIKTLANSKNADSRQIKFNGAISIKCERRHLVLPWNLLTIDGATDCTFCKENSFYFAH